MTMFKMDFKLLKNHQSVLKDLRIQGVCLKVHVKVMLKTQPKIRISLRSQTLRNLHQTYNIYSQRKVLFLKSALKYLSRKK